MTEKVPSEVLTDNGKQFTGRFTKPRPAEVLFERICRENGITARLTKPRSPTTTGKIERFHATLRRELLDDSGKFADLPAAQAAIDSWVHAYNHRRPHQALNMATPASLFRPTRRQPGDPAPSIGSPAVPQVAPAAPAEPAQAALPAAVAILPFSRNAVEFDTVVTASGVLNVLPRVQRLRMDPTYSGYPAHVWVDEFSIHVQIGGEHVRTAPSNLTAADLKPPEIPAKAWINDPARRSQPEPQAS